MKAEASRAEVFERIWRENEWLGSESRSGPGSSLARTANFRQDLQRFLEEVCPRVLYDAPCGDFHWMQNVRLPWGTSYIGADIVAPLIADLQARFGGPSRSFRVADIVEDDPPAEADVWLCRETLFHLTLADAQQVIARWRSSDVEWFLATTTPTVEVNEEVTTGAWRKLNLEAAPFNLEPPQVRLSDAADADPDKFVGVWRRVRTPHRT